MTQLLEEYHFWTTHSYIELRNITATRLTLLCGSRGGEPDRVLLDEWKEAESDSWIDQQRLKTLHPSDVMLVKHLKITYMPGKGNKHLVPILFPPYTVPALKELADPEVRKGAGILESNQFLFASTQGSEIHVPGWHLLKDVCKNVTLQNPDIIEATSQRHQVNTLLAALDLL